MENERQIELEQIVNNFPEQSYLEEDGSYNEENGKFKRVKKYTFALKPEEVTQCLMSVILSVKQKGDEIFFRNLYEDTSHQISDGFKYDNENLILFTTRNSKIEVGIAHTEYGKKELDTPLLLSMIKQATMIPHGK